MRKPAVLTASMMRKGCAHLRTACPVLEKLITLHGPCGLLARRDSGPFQTLATAIIGQQLSIKAADSIGQRVLALIGAFTPAHILAHTPEALRAAGLSAAKARYFIELSTRVEDGRLDLARLAWMPDEDVISALLELPGIGRWTAQMFLIFSLHRPDVLALGDAGLQRAARMLFGDGALLQQVAEPWRPYRSLASWYLWRALGEGGWPQLRTKQV